MRRTMRVLWTAGLIAGACALFVSAQGCEKPLLAPSDERTPYDRYDNVRGQHAPQYIENEYGRRQPNLRGRLTPKD
jgi:hypothetical protein